MASDDVERARERGREARVAYAEERDHIELRREPPSDGRVAWRRTQEWLPVIGAPAVVLVDLQIVYALVPWACRTGARLPFAVTVLAALLAVAGLGMLAVRTWRLAGGGWPGEEVARGVRARFLGALGALVCVFSGAVVLALAAPFLALHPCQ